MVTYLLHTLLLFCSVNVPLLAMDFSYAPESNTVALPATHSTLLVSIQPQRAISTQPAPVSINPATIYNNPSLNPTMPYNLLQLAQMAAVHNVHQAQSSSSNATLGDQLHIQLLRMQQQGDGGSLTELLKSHRRLLSTIFAPVNIQKVKADIALILSVLQDPMTDVLARVKQAPLSTARDCVQKLKDDAPQGAFNHVYMFANQILYERIDYQEQRAQEARKTRIGIHSRGDSKTLSSDRESLEAEIKRCTDDKIRKILTFQLQDVQERLEDPMLKLLHAITVATDLDMVRAAHQQVIDANAERPATYLHGGSIKQGSPLHPDYFGFNVVAAANRLRNERISQLHILSSSTAQTTASSTSPITTAANGSGTTTYSQSPLVSDQNTGIIVDTTSSRMSDRMSLDAVLLDMVSTTRSQDPEYVELYALTCEFFHEIMSQEPLFFDALPAENLADRAAQYAQEYTQQFAVAQQEVKEAKIQEKQRITAELEKYIQAHIPKDCTEFSEHAHGFMTRIKDVKGMARDLTHFAVEVTDLCVDTLIHLILHSKQRADNPLAQATVHKSAKIFKLLDALSVKNMEQFCRNLDALTPQQRAHVLGTILADTVTLMGIVRIPGTVGKVFNGVSNLQSENVIGRSLQQATQSVSQKVERLRVLAEDLGIAPAHETIATTAEGIEAPVTTAAARDSVLMQESAEGIRVEVQKAAGISSITAEIENRLTRNKHLLESLNQSINQLSESNTKRTETIQKIVGNSNISYENYCFIEAETEKFYTAIRSTVSDVEKISRNTGISKNIIERIKKHVFLENHILHNGIGRFAPDADMAAAWKRLIDNTFTQTDLVFLQHEYAESFIMNGLDIAWRDAHDRVNQMYNWDILLQ